MADTYTTKKITELTEKTTADDTDLYVLGNEGSATMRKITFATLAAKIRDKLTSLTFSGFNTTSKTIPGAINELDVGNVVGKTGTAIPANADLDAYQTPGVYYSADSTRTATLSNVPPVNAGFKMLVLVTGSTITQIAIFGASTANKIWERRYYSTGPSWEDWANLALADQDAMFCSGTTYAKLYNAIMKLPLSTSFPVYIDPSVLSTLTDGAMTGLSFRGIVNRNAGNGCDFIGTTGAGQYFIHLRCTLGTSSATVSSLRRMPMSADPMFKYAGYTYSYNIAANSSLNITGTNFGISTPSGYTPLAVRSFYTGSTNVVMRAVYSAASGSSTVMQLRNVSSSAVNDVTAGLSILYGRSDLF